MAPKASKAKAMTAAPKAAKTAPAKKKTMKAEKNKMNTMKARFVFPNGAIISEVVLSTDTVDEVLKSIYCHHGSLFFADRKLENNKKFSDYNIQTEATLHVYPRGAPPQAPPAPTTPDWRDERPYGMSDVRYAGARPWFMWDSLYKFDGE